MRRYFITQHPTFGSYANPIASKIEKSPYFYWWLALTLNKDYIALCDAPSVEQKSSTNTAIHQVYEDFGDVRYEGDKYIAFTKWWRGKVSDAETRGEYLFAEAPTPNKVMLVEDRDTAIQSSEDVSSLLIRIPKSLTRKQIDIAIERIFEKGRQTRNPNRSNARYKLSKPINVETYKMAFNVYEMLLNKERSNVKLSNYVIAKRVGLVVKCKEETLKEQAMTLADERRTISVAVTRKKKMAIDAIRNVAEGKFG
jgi:hypothetical protein